MSPRLIRSYAEHNENKGLIVNINKAHQESVGFDARKGGDVDPCSGNGRWEAGPEGGAWGRGLGRLVWLKGGGVILVAVEWRKRDFHI